MKIIRKLADMIDDELDGAKCYIETALSEKAERPELARTLAGLSSEELGHMSRLHGLVAELIEEHRRERGDPPVEMMAIYDYLHAKHIKAAAEIRELQAMFREG